MTPEEKPMIGKLARGSVAELALTLINLGVSLRRSPSKNVRTKLCQYVVSAVT